MAFQKMVEYIKKERRNVKVLTMGLDNAGKTSVLNALFGIQDDRIMPTFGYRMHRVKYEEWEISLVDVGGQSCFKDYWSNYFEKVDGVLFVVDVNDERDPRGYLKEVLSEGVPVSILMNKVDTLGEASTLHTDTTLNTVSVNVLSDSLHPNQPTCTYENQSNSQPTTITENQQTSTHGKIKAFKTSIYNKASLKQALEWILNQNSHHMHT